MPKISILLPNYRHLDFLETRLDSIFAQTFRDWELIVVDGFSDDGAWEYLQSRCLNDPRIFLKQSPREGVYHAWNECVSLARGDYFYFATSDDSMEPDCLEKMAAALDRHPDCGLVHCCLQIIDENDRVLTGPDSWEEQPVPKYYWQEDLRHEQVHPAPHDGLLHCATGTLFTSITQLLIRRQVFQKIGPFRSDWGPRGDFEWGMRATLLFNLIHLPEYLATWRRHPGQLTNDQDNTAPAIRRQMAAMVETALQTAADLEPGLLRLGPAQTWTKPFRHQALLSERKTLTGPSKLLLILRQWIVESDLIGLDLATLLRWKGRYRPAHRAWMARQLKRQGIPPLFRVN